MNLDLSDVAQVSTLLRQCSNNLNQYAKRVNESGRIYAEDIRDLQKRLNELWRCKADPEEAFGYALTAQMCGISTAQGTDETVCAVTYFWFTC